MNNAPFYVGQEVVCVQAGRFEPHQLKVNDNYIVLDVRFCCRKWTIRVSKGLATTCCSTCHNEHPGFYINAKFFAPIERAKTKYVIKEVEVAPQIRELEVCQS